MLLFVPLQLYHNIFNEYLASHAFVFQPYDCKAEEFLKLLHDAYAMTQPYHARVLKFLMRKLHLQVVAC
jgi:hypothetical protein